MSESPDCTVVPDEPTLRFPQDGVARVPFRRGLNHVLVDVTDANGGTHAFFLDTGASFSVITPVFLETADAPRREGETLDAAHGVGGELAATPTLHELEHLRVGDLQIERAGAVHLDLGLDEELGLPIEGVLGFNVLSNLVTVIDYGAGEVSFHEPGRGPADADHTLPFRLRGGALIELQGRVSGAEAIPFILDIGSPWTFLNRQAASSGAEPGEAWAPVGGVSCSLARPRSLQFGSLAFDRPEVRAADLPVFETVGLGSRSAGILGNDLLGGHRVALDYAAAEVRIWSPAEAGPSLPR